MRLGPARLGVGNRGRHRARPARLSVIARLTTGTLLLATAGVVAAVWSPAANAVAPARVGWWNADSGGGQAAPSPTTPAGGLRVAVQPGQMTAFGAVLFSLPKDATGTLVLKVAQSVSTPAINPSSPTTAPAINIQGCPTKDTNWKAGDDQPIADAPAYDCSTHGITGNLSTDGKTLTFFVDPSLDVTPGQLSLALVPVQTNEAPGAGTPLPVSTTQPFAVDFDKPDASSLTLTGSLPQSAPPPPPPPPAAGGTTGGTTSGAGSTSAGGTSTSTSGGSMPPTVNVGSGATTTTVPPAGSGTPPDVAGTGTTPAATAPAAASSPASSSSRGHNAALALLVLLGFGVLATSNRQMPRVPRRLGGGGAGRHAAAVAGAAAEAAAVMSPYGSRGLGRFAKPRTTPPRPLV